MQQFSALGWPSLAQIPAVVYFLPLGTCKSGPYRGATRDASHTTSVELHSTQPNKDWYPQLLSKVCAGQPTTCGTDLTSDDKTVTSLSFRLAGWRATGHSNLQPSRGSLSVIQASAYRDRLPRKASLSPLCVSLVKQQVSPTPHHTGLCLAVLGFCRCN